MNQFERLGRDPKVQILLNLDDESLVSMCQVNRDFRDICNNNQDFWLLRTLREFPYLTVDIIDRYRGNMTNAEYYISLTRIRKMSYSVPELSDDFRDNRLDRIMVTAYLKPFLFDVITDDLTGRSDLDLEIVEFLALFPLRGKDIREICNELYQQLKARYDEDYGDDYGIYLITLLFNPDLGLIPVLHMQARRWDIYGGPWSPNRDQAEVVKDLMVRAAQLIHAKVETPDLFPELYSDFSEESPGVEEYVTNSLEITPEERDLAVRAYNHLNTTYREIFDRYAPIRLTKAEASLALLMYTWYRMGKFPLEAKWAEVCQSISNY